MSGKSASPRLVQGSMDRITKSWLSATEYALDSVLAANRAALAASGLTNGDVHQEADVAALAYTDPQWTSEQTHAKPGTVTVGDRISFSKRIDNEDIEWFAAASGDTNRLHLDDRYAADSRFGGRIAHGTLISGLISAALARLPGLTVYLSQDVSFLRPVEIGDEVRAECEVIEDLGGDRFRLSTEVFTEDGTQVIDGEAIVLIDDLQDEDA